MVRVALSSTERTAVAGGRWFASLSPMLRHEILHHGSVRCYADGELIFGQGHSVQHWHVVAQGAVRISSEAISGRGFTLAYLKPGIWFGDEFVFDETGSSYSAEAKGRTTVFSIDFGHVRQLVGRNAEFYEALLTLQSRRARWLYTLVQELHELPLRARLAKRLLEFVSAFGEASFHEPSAISIGLLLDQTELAKLLGVSRQRVNQALSALGRAGLISTGLRMLIIHDCGALARVAQGKSISFLSHKYHVKPATGPREISECSYQINSV